MAIARVDAQLADDLVVVLAPVLEVDQGEVQGRAVVAVEALDASQDLSRFVNVGCGDLVEQAGELAVGEGDRIEALELFSEVGFQGLEIGELGAVSVFQRFELLDEPFLDVGLTDLEVVWLVALLVAVAGGVSSVVCCRAWA